MTALKLPKLLVATALVVVALSSTALAQAGIGVPGSPAAHASIIAI